MSSQPDHVSHPWRRFLRFSVRGLIVLVLVVGARLGWIVHEAHVQRDAVAAIERTGGEVIYDSGWSDGPLHAPRKPRAPKWLVNTIGIDYFSHAFGVVVAPASTDNELAHVGRLVRLRSLSLVQSNVSDAGLVHLKGLTNLSVLGLRRAEVTDAGLVYLKGLTNLSVLNLGGTRVTDAGLTQLKELTNLSVLDLGGTRVTGAGLTQLKGLPNLSGLGLYGTEVTDAGLEHLKGLTNLSELGLQDTQVTDAGWSI
jgi:hypothetical protein